MYYTSAWGLHVSVQDNTASINVFEAVTHDADAWSPVIPLIKGHTYTIKPRSSAIYFLPIK